MDTLFVAGDSYASLAIDQPADVSWSEILAKKLDCQLYNVARPHSSNFGIVTQIDYFLNKISSNDFVVILLTDRNRMLLPSNLNVLDRAKFLPYQGLHRLQKNYNDIPYSSNKELVPTRFVDKEYSEYYQKYFNPDLAQFQDEYMLTGAFTKILNKTQNLLVCSGGYSNELVEKVSCGVNATTFSLKENNFIDFSSSKMHKIGGGVSINHMDNIGHAKFASLLYNKIRKGVT